MQGILIVSIILILLVLIFIFLLIHKNTSIVDGKIIRVEEKRNYGGVPPYNTTSIITIMYSYIVDNKQYVSTITDDFGVSKFFYKYRKNKSNKNESTSIHYVENENIKVRYKNNNPENSKINNFILKEWLCLLLCAFIFGVIVIVILGIVWYLYH